MHEKILSADQTYLNTETYNYLAKKEKQNKTKQNKQTKTKQQQQQKPITFLLFPRNCALHIQSRQKLITSQTALQDRSSLKLGIQGMSLQTMTPFKG